MIKFLLFLLLCVSVNFAQAQDLMLSVKRGKAIINGKDWLVNYPPKKIVKTDKISATDNAILLIRKGSAIAKINCPCTSLSFTVLNNKVAANKSKVTYADVIFNKPLEAEAKKQTGGVSRGTEGEIDTLSINLVDTAWIMNDVYRVQWRSDLPSTQVGNMRLYQVNKSTPIIESAEKYLDLKGLQSGWYHIDFEINQKAATESWTAEASYVFYVPTAQEKEQVMQEYKGIKEELEQFEDDELSEIILDSYRKDRRLFGLSE